MNRRGIHGVGLVPPVMMGGNFDEAYLLRDDFLDTLAAGSVNGTRATPGGIGGVALNTRNVVDVSGDGLSLSGGLASFANPSAVSGDPGLWYGAITRARGRVMLCKVNYTSVAQLSFCGFDTDQTGGMGSNSFTQRSSGFWSWQVGNVNMSPYVITTNYILAIVLRVTGAYLFVKGGVYTNFTLMPAFETNAAATLYPCIETNSSVYTVDFVRIPVVCWLPTPLASDGMSSATLTDGLGHAEGITGGIGAGGGNVPWATAATWAVAGGVALNTPVLGGELAVGNLVVGTWYSITATQVNYFYVGCAIGDSFRATAATGLDAFNKVKAFTTAELVRPLNTSFTADVIAQVKAVAMTARTHSGLAIRLNDPTTPTSGILAYFDKGSITVVEFSGATYTQLFTAVKAFTASDSLQLIADDVNVRLIHLTSAGVATLIGSTAVATITTGGYHGLFSTDSGNTLDNLVIYSRGTDNSYSILDRWSK